MEKFAQNIETNRMDFYKGLGFYTQSPAILVPIAQALAFNWTSTDLTVAPLALKDGGGLMLGMRF